jgi:hypothetical protein
MKTMMMSSDDDDGVLCGLGGKTGLQKEAANRFSKQKQTEITILLGSTSHLHCMAAPLQAPAAFNFWCLPI